MAILWADSNGFHTIKPWMSVSESIDLFVTKCKEFGIDRIVAGQASLELVQAARKIDIEVDSYVALNYHGEYKSAHGWSLNYALPSVESNIARSVIDNHRPILDYKPPEMKISDFAIENPQFWSMSSLDSKDLKPGERLTMSLANSVVREHEVAKYSDMFKKSKPSGLQVEFVLGNEDHNGFGLYGYQKDMIDSFEKQTGRSIQDVNNDDMEWVQFRADQTTLFLKDLRDSIGSSVRISVTVISREETEYLKVGQDWEKWASEGLIDELYIWFRTTNDLNEVSDGVDDFVRKIHDRCPVIAEFSCYHPGSFQEEEEILKASSIAKSKGANSVGIYKAQSVEQLNLWPVLNHM